MGWIGIDLDGTIAQYAGWQGVDNIGEPLPAMVALVKGFLAEGREVRIFTARVSHLYGKIGNAYTNEDAIKRISEARRAEEAIQQWCLKHLGQKLPVTALKDYDMIELYDDRALRVEHNTGRVIVDSRPIAQIQTR